MAREKFDHSVTEKAAQEKWEKLDLYCTDLTDTTKEPYYLLFEFPYPSGDLHVGHWYAFAITDIFARFKRMRGFNVLFPFGFDAFGLPAENAAIKRGLDPRKWTYENMDTMREQVKTMGTSLDFSKEIITCSPEYYRWTQWLFARFYEKRIAYRGSALVNWDPIDMTVLANEQVLPDGTAERSGAVVEKKELVQWFMRITEYANRLITDLDPLPWKEEIKDAQRAWIGKSEGADIPFTLISSAGENKISVFTTRADTLYGVTYVVLAPELALVDQFLKSEVLKNADEVRAYSASTKSKTDRDRMQHKEKTGVELEGVRAIHPITGEELPVYIADYVLASYGTGAVMAVPAHDERDFAFAKKFNLPIVQVIAEPIIQTEEPGAHKPNEALIPSDGVIVIIKHWSEEKFLALRWKKVAWVTFLTGGVDEGYTPEQTVLKEILEETGFLSAKIVEKLFVVDGLFYHVPKAINKQVHGHIFVVELLNGERKEIEEEENDKHEISWRTTEELAVELTAGTHKAALQALLTGYKPYGGSGSLVNSDTFTGKSNESVLEEIVALAGGTMKTQFRLRDWGISRQRYWGCPIPVVYDPQGNAHLVPDEHLPWLLPEDVDLTPGKNTSPLASSTELKERVTRIFGEGWTPEYDTLDTFVDSSWYFMRYLAPNDTENFSDPELMRKWLPVNRYSGGSEHTTLHLLYSRFFNKAMFDMGLAPTTEPFIERMNRGLILGTDGNKMSKSKGNTVNPDEYVQKYGADAVRMYLAFIGPYNEAGSYPWKPEGVESMRRFLDRVYTLGTKVVVGTASIEEKTALAKTTEKLNADIERFKLNTAVSALMILLNEFEAQASVSTEAFETFLVLLSPLAPHLAETLYEVLPGHVAGSSVHQHAWPEVDTSLLISELVTIGVQVAGKRRGEISITLDASEEVAVEAAMSIELVKNALHGKNPGKVVYVKGKILNLLP